MLRCELCIPERIEGKYYVEIKDSNVAYSVCNKHKEELLSKKRWSFLQDWETAIRTMNEWNKANPPTHSLGRVSV
jgi:hypothetical protein